MSSNLYQMAVTLLQEEERSGLAAFEKWLADFRQETSVTPLAGNRILENIRAETHLTGDSPWGDCSELRAFLRGCAEKHEEGSPDSNCCHGYEETCKDYVGRGLRITLDYVPELLLRYTRSESLALNLVEAILGDQAMQDLLDGGMTWDDAFERLASSWDSSLIEEDCLLGAGTAVFATFEHVSGAPRANAFAMAQALALPTWSRREEILIELSYATNSVEDHRFPTVADVGWAQEFQPAQEMEPDPARPETCSGWTRPLGAWPAQPELVHKNESLRVLTMSPRFVGRYTR